MSVSVGLIPGSLELGRGVILGSSFGWPVRPRILGRPTCDTCATLWAPSPWLVVILFMALTTAKERVT